MRMDSRWSRHSACAIRHIKFGVGSVTDIREGGRDYEVTVNFDRVGVKKMFASFAKLTKVEG